MTCTFDVDYLSSELPINIIFGSTLVAEVQRDSGESV